ncbi:unnamed protein product, partial [Rotaria magnacalcarata]
ARFYLEFDYKVHVTRSSNITDHCCIYALSDPKKRDFSQDCDHEHDESCIECSNLTSTLNKIERFLEETEKDEELLDRTLKKFRSYHESIEAWKAHLLRSINQDLCRENLLDKLSNNEIYLNLDWAMKFLPIKSREPQSEFFGKRGISWHITVISEKTGIAIGRIDFCDLQDDKGPCDRYAAVIKSNIRRYLSENHNITSASEFVEACHSHKGVKGVLALGCQIMNNARKKEIKCKIKQITYYFNFEYLINGLLVHRSWNVGSGLLIPWSQLNCNRSIFNLISRGIEGFVHEWVQTNEHSANQNVDVDDCVEQEEMLSTKISELNNLYECNVESGCTAAFVKFGNLINHIL